jgi:hypothetical protein
MRRLVIALFLTACAGPGSSSAPAASPEPVAQPGPARTEAPSRYAEPATGLVQIEMRNVHYRPTDRIAMQIDRLRGELVPIGVLAPVLGDAKTFKVELRAAKVRVAPDALAALMNDRVFAAPSSPVKAVAVSTKDGVLVMRGRLRGAVPFRTSATVSAEPDGRLRIHTISIESLGVGVKGMAKLAGVRLEDLVGKAPGEGLTAEGNDLLLDVAKAVPDPKIEGPIREVSVGPAGMTLVFGAAPGLTRGTRRKLRPPLPGAPNYVYLDGATLAIGRLTMKPARMQIVDRAPEDPFDFHQQRFEKEQLPKGSERVLVDGGLEVFIPDWTPDSRQETPVSGRE